MCSKLTGVHSFETRARSNWRRGHCERRNVTGVYGISPNRTHSCTIVPYMRRLQTQRRRTHLYDRAYASDGTGIMNGDLLR